MATIYKGTYKCSCPYFVKEKDKRIVCLGQELKFDTPVEKTEYRDKNCFFPIPKKCEIYLEHKKAIEEGKEKKIPPRSSMDYSDRDKTVEYKRQRRANDPTFKW